MRRIIVLVSAVLLSASVMAAPSWKIYEVAVSPGGQQAVLEATDKFMKSAKGKSYGGGLHVNVILANGISPATHSFVMLMPSIAAITDWEASLAGDADAAAFFNVLSQHQTVVSDYMGSLVKAWGDVSNEDRVWMVTRFYTTDPLRVLEAQNKLMADPATKKFPGQVALHATSLGNRSGANNQFSTHLFAVGYKDVAEMEAWTSYSNTQPAWAEYLTSVRDVVTWQGTELLQNAAIYDAALDLEGFTNQ